MIYDAVGSFGLPGGWVDELRDAGCRVIAFNPIAQWRRRFRLSHRDHRKIIVVDDEVAFTGGLNISNDYASVEDGGEGWHDMHCRCTGPIVGDLARMFRRSWLRGGGAPYPTPRIPPPAASGGGGGGGGGGGRGRRGGGAPRARGAGAGSYARLIDNTRRRQRATTRRAYLHVLRAAREAVLIENAYFLPDRGLRRAMTRAARRGVDLRVIVPGHSDVRLIEWASLYVLRKLARVGVKVYRWRGVMLHAKTCVVDGILVDDRQLQLRLDEPVQQPRGHRRDPRPGDRPRARRQLRPRPRVMRPVRPGRLEAPALVEEGPRLDHVPPAPLPLISARSLRDPGRMVQLLVAALLRSGAPTASR